MGVAGGLKRVLSAHSFCSLCLSFCAAVIEAGGGSWKSTIPFGDSGRGGVSSVSRI